ncbi:hypothetical protein KCP70_18080 [Salmonella enterica subsp. enterica]|nr:hypothetical protein KCP70_18080 [Salmonella enterica subsp. enterica]
MLRISVGVAPLTPQIGHYREWLSLRIWRFYKARMPDVTARNGGMTSAGLQK